MSFQHRTFNIGAASDISNRPVIVMVPGCSTVPYLGAVPRHEGSTPRKRFKIALHKISSMAFNGLNNFARRTGISSKRVAIRVQNRRLRSGIEHCWKLSAQGKRAILCFTGNEDEANRARDYIVDYSIQKNKIAPERIFDDASRRTVDHGVCSKPLIEEHTGKGIADTHLVLCTNGSHMYRMTLAMSLVSPCECTAIHIEQLRARRNWFSPLEMMDSALMYRDAQTAVPINLTKGDFCENSKRVAERIDERHPVRAWRTDLSIRESHDCC